MLDADMIKYHIDERDRLRASNLTYAPVAKNAAEASQILVALGSTACRANKGQAVEILIAIDCEYIADNPTAIALEVAKFVAAIRTAISRFRKDMQKNKRPLRNFSTRYINWKQYPQDKRFPVLRLVYSEDSNINAMFSGKRAMANLLADG